MKNYNGNINENKVCTSEKEKEIAKERERRHIMESVRTEFSYVALRRLKKNRHPPIYFPNARLFCCCGSSGASREDDEEPKLDVEKEVLLRTLCVFCIERGVSSF